MARVDKTEWTGIELGVHRGERKAGIVFCYKQTVARTSVTNKTI
jgi:hypothetical protein